MAAVNILTHSEQGTTTLSGTANTAQEFRVHVADYVSIQSADAIELWYDEADGASVTEGNGHSIKADTPYVVPVDRRRLSLDGYFSFQVSSATASAEIEWAAESGRAS